MEVEGKLEKKEEEMTKKSKEKKYRKMKRDIKEKATANLKVEESDMQRQKRIESRKWHEIEGGDRTYEGRTGRNI